MVTVIVTLLSELDADKIVSILVKNGYTISAGAADHKLCHGFSIDTIAGNCCFTMTGNPSGDKSKSNSSALDFLDYLKAIFEKNNIKYFSLIVAKGDQLNWASSNIKRKEEVIGGPYR